MVLLAVSPAIGLFVYFPIDSLSSVFSAPSLVRAVVLTGVIASLAAYRLFWRPLTSLTEAARRVRWESRDHFRAPKGIPSELRELGTEYASTISKVRRVHRAHKTPSEIKRSVARAREEQPLLNEICRVIVRDVGYRVAMVVYTGPDTKPQAMAQEGCAGGMEEVASVIAQLSFEAASGPFTTTIRTGKPHVAQHIMTDPNLACWQDYARRNGVGSCAILPIAVESFVVGALGVYAEEPDAFDQEEVDLLTEAVKDLSVGVALLRARKEQDRATATIERLVHYDRLTGLPNHTLFDEHFRRALSDAKSFAQTLASYIIDLNRLRDVNDAFGFHHGDEVLREVASRVKKSLGAEGLLARMRGDEFAVLCRVQGERDADQLAIKLHQSLEAPFNIDGTKIDISFTIGVSLYPQHGNDPSTLMRHADVAMHEAKKLAKSHAFYRQEQDEDRAQRLALVADLRRGIQLDELVLHYQPKIDIQTSRVCGVEALVRWAHPTRGFLSPDKFIGLAENAGLIRPLTNWVFAEALRESSRWRRAGIDLPIAINLSPHSLRDPSLVATVERYLREWNADPSWWEFEITESAVMEDPKGALEILTSLRQMGIVLSIDDFGTGYSSLGYLKRLPVDAVKIDKSFVIDMTDASDSEAIVRTTIALGHELGLKVVAEGVESGAALDHLASLRCDIAQGYYISKPIKGADLKEWMQHGGWNAAKEPLPMPSVPLKQRGRAR